MCLLAVAVVCWYSWPATGKGPANLLQIYSLKPLGWRRQPQPAEDVHEYSFDCEATPITARYVGRTRVEVSVNAALLVLKPSESADAARYSDDAGNQLWTQGSDRVTLKLTTGNEPKHCTAAPKASAAA